MDGSISFAAAFGAGVLSFLSPCVLPIVPGYLGFITGMSLDELRGGTSRKAVLVPALFFVTGFTLIFVLLGASATLIGAVLNVYQDWIARIGGILIIVFGLHLLGVFRIAPLLRERRLQLANSPRGYAGAAVAGAAFGAGWTPCLGPVLGGILMLAATRGSVGDGVGLLFVYSAGLAIPFLAAALLLDHFLGGVRKIGPWFPWVSRLSGALLIAVGVLMFTGSFSILSAMPRF